MCDVLHCLVEVFFLIAYNTIGTIWNYCLVLLNSRSKQLGVIEPVVRNGLITVLQTSSALVSHKDPVSGQTGAQRGLVSLSLKSHFTTRKNLS